MTFEENTHRKTSATVYKTRNQTITRNQTTNKKLRYSKTKNTLYKQKRYPTER